MADFSHHDKTSDEDFFLHEAYVVWEIALHEANAMQHNPGFVHLAGASLYRLRDTNLTLAKGLGITVYHIRNWTMENLPTTNPFGRRYAGHIDFDYRIERRLDRMHVGKVRKPPKGVSKPLTEHRHPPGGGRVIMVERNDPAASELWAESIRSSLQFVKAIHADSDASESPATTVRRILTSLLSTAEVQTCLKDIRVSADELRSKLGEPFDQAE